MKGMEIERKWLIRPENIPYNLEDLPHHALEQCYLCFSPTLRIRSYDNDSRCVFTMKSSAGEGGLVRGEWELPLSADNYHMLRNKAEGTPVYKTRYIHKREDGLTEEIDIFDGILKGLAYLEIEFDDEVSARAFSTPEWTIREVTHDHAYKNSQLARYGMPADAMKD